VVHLTGKFQGLLVQLDGSVEAIPSDRDQARRGMTLARRSFVATIAWRET
jgi:hypothetical protein